jgi:NAD(P)-dependent dehydrogenase (short-subunit alcohol dehydrogenase family)
LAQPLASSLRAEATPWPLPNVSSEAAAHEIEAKMSPLKRVAQPEEIAGLVADVVNDEAGYMTGASLTIDGGFNLQVLKAAFSVRAASRRSLLQHLRSKSACLPSAKSGDERTHCHTCASAKSSAARAAMT